MEKKAKSRDEFLTYKGRPLVRCGNMMYYGNMWEKYVILMQVVNTAQFKGNELSGKIIVQLISTDNDMRARERIIKKTEKDGLYNAIDIGSIWLERALTE